MTEVAALVDHLFRRSAGQMVATLTRAFGAAHLDVAEEVVQDALLTALAQWPYTGIPANPTAWLFRVARNRALDQLRRDARIRDKERDVIAAFRDREQRAEGAFAHELADDDLQLMLMCCDPRIAAESRLAFTLKTVCGFSVEEIARALLAQPAAIAQRLVRVKKSIRESGMTLELPSRDELPRRLGSVLDVVYLMFNEGSSAHSGEDLIRRDLVTEALRVGNELAAHPLTAQPRTFALLALLHLQAARIPARVDGGGDLLLLDAQDRSLWDRELIARGIGYLVRAASGDDVTRFHIEAAIAAAHAAAPSFEQTDWRQILGLYDDLLWLAPSPVVVLNRAIAVAMLEGPEAGLREIEHLAMPDYLPYHAAIGELASRAGDRARAETHFRRAAALAATPAQRRHFERRSAR